VFSFWNMSSESVMCMFCHKPLLPSMRIRVCKHTQEKGLHQEQHSCQSAQDHTQPPQVSRDKQAQCTEARKRIPHKRLEKHPYEPHQLPSKSGSTRKAWTTTGEKAGSERAGATCRYASTHMREGCTKSSTPVKVHTTILNPDR